MLYTSLVSFEVLLFSNANWTVSSNHRSINMSVASLLKMRIVPLFFVFFEAIFLHAKSTRFWRPKAHFRPQSLRFRGRVLIAKTLGTRLPLVSARGPKNLLLHGKNQACRAPYYWPACQNLGVPYPKWVSCKCALKHMVWWRRSSFSPLLRSGQIGVARSYQGEPPMKLGSSLY